MVFPSSVKMGFGGEWDLHQKTQKLKTHPKFGFREGSIHFHLFRRQEDGEEESSAQSPPQVGNQNKAKEWQLFAAQAFADIRPSSQGELLMGILLRSLVLLWDVVYFISNLAYLGTCIQLVFLYVYLRRSYV